jgi:cytochrome c553
MELRVVLLGFAALTASLHAGAQPDGMAVRSMAATCANCHGTDGHALPGAAVPGLAGRPRDELLQQLLAFRNGSRPATIMQQIAKGFSENQLQQLATYFAAQSK